MLIDSRASFIKHYPEFNTLPVEQVIYAGGIVVQNGKVLVLKRAGADADSPEKWVLPGGKKDKFEAVEVAVLREVLEETGLQTKIICIASTFGYQVVKDDCVRDTTQINFALVIVGKVKVVLSDEHDRFAWLTLAEVQDSSLSAEVKSGIEIALHIKAKLLG